MRRGIFLAVAALLLLVGCGSPDDKGIPIGPRWKGAPYRIAFDTKAVKPAPVGLTLPGVKFTANPEALETRAVLLVRFVAQGTGNKGEITNRIVLPAVDISGTEGSLPADYMERTSKGLSSYLAGYCLAGNVKVSVALARSSVNSQGTDAEIDGKRLSDWQTVELPYKNSHPKC